LKFLFILIIFLLSGCGGGGGGVSPVLPTPTTAVSNEVNVYPDKVATLSLSDGSQLIFPENSVTDNITIKAEVLNISPLNFPGNATPVSSLYHFKIVSGNGGSYIANSATLNLPFTVKKDSLHHLYVSYNNQKSWISSGINVTKGTISARLSSLEDAYTLVAQAAIEGNGKLTPLSQVFAAKEGALDIYNDYVTYGPEKRKIRLMYADPFTTTINIPVSYRCYIGGELDPNNQYIINAVNPADYFVGVVLIYNEAKTQLLWLVSVSRSTYVYWNGNPTANVNLGGEFLPYSSTSTQTYSVEIYALSSTYEAELGNMGNVYIFLKEVPPLELESVPSVLNLNGKITF